MSEDKTYEGWCEGCGGDGYITDSLTLERKACDYWSKDSASQCYDGRVYKTVKYTDSCKFDEVVGVLSEEELIELGWPVDNGNRICFSQYEQLKEFVDFLNAINFEGEQYHIATDIDPCSDEVMAITVNNVAYVNRLDYYLCKGDDDEELYLEELRSDYE